MLKSQNEFTNLKNCFVCKTPIMDKKLEYNSKINLPVCTNCIDSEEEVRAVKMALESLGEDFVCGCI